MTIKIGDSLPAGTWLNRSATTTARTARCRPSRWTSRPSAPARKWSSSACRAHPRPTCSGSHVPGYLKNFDALKAKGVDAIVCMAVNDGFVMGAWGRSQNVGDKRSACWATAPPPPPSPKRSASRTRPDRQGMGVPLPALLAVVDDGVCEAGQRRRRRPTNCSFARTCWRSSARPRVTRKAARASVPGFSSIVLDKALI